MSDLLNDTVQLSTTQVYFDQLTAQLRITNAELHLIREGDYMEDLVIRVVRKLAYIPGDEKITVPRIVQQGLSVPATWWDAFKERHFDVLLRWFPVRHIVLQEAKVLQYGQTYEARQYMPDFPLPEKYAGPVEILRMQPLDKTLYRV